MKEEALRIAKKLLRNMPQLNTSEVIAWEETGFGIRLISLCALLKGNAVPARSLVFDCKRTYNIK